MTLRKPTPWRQQRGRKAQAAGDAWEEYLKVLHAGYHRRGLAYVFRGEPPTRVLRGGKDGAPKVIRVGAGVPDFIACIDGMFVAAEAKRRKDRSLPWSGISDDQAERLQAVEDSGRGLSVLLVSIGGAPPPAGCLVVPWAVARDPWDRWQLTRATPGNAPKGVASASYEALVEAGAVPFNRDGWLGPVLGLLAQREMK